MNALKKSIAGTVAGTLAIVGLGVGVSVASASTSSPNKLTACTNSHNQVVKFYPYVAGCVGNYNTIHWSGGSPTTPPRMLNPVTDGPYTTTWKGDSGASLQEAVVKCDSGKIAVGGGFSQQGGSDDLGGTNKDIQITVSTPYTDNYQPVNSRGSLKPNEWIVKGYNNGTTDAVIRPWVTCVDDDPAQ